MRLSSLASLTLILLGPARAWPKQLHPPLHPHPRRTILSSRQAYSSPAKQRDAGQGHPPDGPTTWYGWQTLTTDALSVGLVVVGSSNGSSGVALLGVGTYLAGGPVVHAAHHRPNAIAGSLGLRVAAPHSPPQEATALAESRAAPGARTASSPVRRFSPLAD